MAAAFYPATTGDFFLAALERFMRSTGQGEHFGVTVLRLKSMPDLLALRAAWARVFEQHPVVGGRLQRRWRGWQLGWRVEGSTKAPEIVVHQGQRLTDATILDRLSRSTPERLRMEVFTQAEGTGTVLLTWRHGIIDGVGLGLLLEQLSGQAPALAAPPAMARPRPPLKQFAKQAKQAIETLKLMTCTGNYSAWHRGTKLPAPRGFRVIELSVEQSARVSEAQRRHGGDFFHMPFYAAVTARALKRVHELRGLPPGYCHLEVPYQAGKRPAGAVFQNQMATLLLPLLESQMDTCEAAVKHVMAVYREAMKSGLPQATAALMVLVMHLPVRLFIPFIRFQNEGEICGLFHSHTGTLLAQTPNFAGAEVDNVFNIPSVCTPPGLGIFFSEFQQRLTITLAWREGSLNAEEQEAVANGLVEDLTA